MKLISLSVRNFRLLASVDIDFPESGITGIVGTNGAGKSTILEVILWILFGGKATRGTKSGIRWQGATKPAEGTLIFVVAGHTYKCWRSETNAKLWNTTTGEFLAQNSDPVTTYMPKLLGLDLEKFTASYFVHQKDIARIASMKPTERQVFVRDVMGVGVIDDALAACRKRRNELGNERDALMAGLGDRGPLEVDLADATSALALAKAARGEQEDEVAVAEVARDDVREAFKASEALRLQVEKARGLISAAETRLTMAKSESARLTALRLRQDEAAERIKAAAPDLARIPALRSERDELLVAKAAAGERESLAAQEADLVADIEEQRQEIIDCQKAIDDFDEEKWESARKESARFGQELEALRATRRAEMAMRVAHADAHQKEADRHERRLKAIREAGEAGECPTCLRRLGDAYAVVVETLEKALRDEIHNAGIRRVDADVLLEPGEEEQEMMALREVAEDTVAAWTPLMKAAQDAVISMGSARTTLVRNEQRLAEVRQRAATVATIAYDADRHWEVEASILALTEISNGLEADRGLVADRGVVATAWADAQAAVQGATDKLRALELEVQGYAFDSQANATLRQELAVAEEALNGHRTSLARAEEGEKHAGARVEACRRALSAYDERASGLEALSADHLTHEQAAARLAEFRTAVASTVRPEMEELISGFVQMLTDGRHEGVELTEDFQVVLYENGQAMEVVSGGTEDITALAMRLAICQMIAERAGRPLSLLLLDEVFGSLDEVRRGNVLALLRAVNSVFEQVIVISHVGETRDAVDHAIELVHDADAGLTRIQA